jgi:hypothetical protein
VDEDAPPRLLSKAGGPSGIHIHASSKESVASSMVGGCCWSRTVRRGRSLQPHLASIPATQSQWEPHTILYLEATSKSYSTRIRYYNNRSLIASVTRTGLRFVAIIEGMSSCCVRLKLDNSAGGAMCVGNSQGTTTSHYAYRHRLKRLWKFLTALGFHTFQLRNATKSKRIM